MITSDELISKKMGQLFAEINEKGLVGYNFHAGGIIIGCRFNDMIDISVDFNNL